ncbi:CBN-LIN-49 protein [Caenorhabditis brenneri]|uniref:CBN-LIN-49 protein n=1 Tax=Caenorhabditis brenneri TaxID=135651 RepID=G0PF49_CAEBE|nr:CBN-LIN-49 protein [Caenorhabditis brenneri]
MAVIDQLKGIDEGNVFAEPVDLVGYRDIIEHPISLRDMIEKANSGGYASISDLAADVHLMVQNCYKFNKGNQIYINIGRKYQKKSQKILEAAKKTETDRQEFNGDKDFMSRLLNGVLGDYTGPKGVSRPEILYTGAHTSLRPLRGTRQIKVEVIEDEEMAGHAPQAQEAQAPPPIFKKPGRKRNLLEEVEDTPPVSRTIRPRPPVVVVDTPTTSRKRTTTQATPTLHQTKLTSFFGATPKQQWEQRAPKKEAHVHFADSPEKSARLLFNDIPSTSAQSSSSSSSSASSSTNPFLLPQPSSAPSSSNSRPATRSTSVFLSTSQTPTVTRSSRFRMPSSNIQSPLPTTTKVGKHAMDLDSDDDPDAEIQIQPALPGGSGIQMTPEEIRREKLRSAENEARSKFAHNQLVLVDGRAAKVIEMPMAHMEMETEQRAAIITRRREVLSEIPKSTPICVQFFHQKSNAAAEYQWVTSDRVELLDLNTVGNGGQKSPKIPGLKAARDWHQQVLNGSK